MKKIGWIILLFIIVSCTNKPVDNAALLNARDSLYEAIHDIDYWKHRCAYKDSIINRLEYNEWEVNYHTDSILYINNKYDSNNIYWCEIEHKKYIAEYNRLDSLESIVSDKINVLFDMNKEEIIKRFK